MTEKILYMRSSTNLSREKINLNISSFYSVIGWIVEKDDVDPSAPLSAGSWAGILEITTECLSSLGLHVGIDEVSCWHESLGDIHIQDPPVININNLPHFLMNLRRQEGSSSRSAHQTTGRLPQLVYATGRSII